MDRIADAATNRVAEYVSKLGVKVTTISKATGIPDGMLRRSLSSKERSLRADEFLKICGFLEKEPLDFAQNTDQTSV